MLSANSNVFPLGAVTAWAVFMDSMGWRCLCQSLCRGLVVWGGCPRWRGWVSSCRGVCCWGRTLPQRQPRPTWRTTTSARPSATPSPNPSRRCWCVAGTPVPRWVSLPWNGGFCLAHPVSVCMGLPQSPGSEGSATAESPVTDNGVTRNTEGLMNQGGKQINI